MFDEDNVFPGLSVVRARVRGLASYVTVRDFDSITAVPGAPHIAPAAPEGLGLIPV